MIFVPKATVTLNGLIRDFPRTFSDFEKTVQDDLGIPQVNLGNKFKIVKFEN